ncbi:MAG TPA: TRAP transporter small permease [Dehalococcoidales bacterium]|nr:TRAP transporter small permease [Dehalococcoidales bacterium]
MSHILAKAVRKVHFGVLNAQKLLLIFLFLPLTLTMFAETVARYALGIGFFAIEDFVGYTAVWLYFIGAAVATHERTQVKAELTGMFLKNPRALSILRAVVAAISVGVAAIMTQWTYAFVVWSVHMNETTPVHQVPMVYFEASLLVGSFLMTVYFTLELVDNIRRAFHPSLPSEGKEA